MALKGPSEYWKTKQTTHGDKARSLKFIAALYAVVGITAIYKLVTTLLVGYGEGIIPPIWMLTLIALSSLIILWGGKLIVRSLLSHLHLKEDAHEREFLIKTYLAMISDNASKFDDSTDMILKSIFKNASAGIIHDDGMPNVPISSVVNKITKI